MAYYDALRTLWATLPASDSTVQKLATVNAMTAPGPNVDVPVSQVAGYLALQGKLSAIQAYAQSAVAGTNGATQQSVTAAKELVTLLSTPSVTTFRMSDPVTFSAVQGFLNALAADPNSGMTSSDVSTLLAMAQPTIPWWAANGYASSIGYPDLAMAGNLS